ncbi:hypothetical protein ACFYZJ_11800 [Streptomyces sp. NPDC001848]|uniref:hypothetical protein n=1 Tax=Streptomyces sp. NPDC001848 TaxID=3364618 RepID=UPI0036AB9541
MTTADLISTDVTTADRSTAERRKKPPRTPARHRRFDGQLAFPQDLVAETTGAVRMRGLVPVLEQGGRRAAPGRFPDPAEPFPASRALVRSLVLRIRGEKGPRWDTWAGTRATGTVVESA